MFTPGRSPSVYVYIKNTKKKSVNGEKEKSNLTSNAGITTHILIINCGRKACFTLTHFVCLREALALLCGVGVLQTTYGDDNALCRGGRNCAVCVCVQL